MSSLRKQCIVRACFKPKAPAVTAGDDYYGRGSQIIEISQWLETNVDCSKWFSGNVFRLSHDMICIYAQRISISTGLPCCGLIRQLINYAALSATSSLCSDNYDDILLNKLSTALWVFCTSSYEQLLIMLYGLYDVHDEGLLTRSTMMELLTDVLVDDLSSCPGNAVAGRESVKVSELLDELFEYAEATKTVLNGNDLEKADSIEDCNSEVSYDCIAAARHSPIDPQFDEGISLLTFVNFFTKRKKGSFWHLLSFQKKLKQASFGIEQWQTVTDWARKQPKASLSMSGLEFSALYRSLSTDVVKFIAYRRNQIPL
eukprot:CAMPEP_0182429250 /NCGR_PEP_ID=MMETSP1167-20130531/25621_1 /TAXON_ID=2988 /ORGANISM="Mallomonas Sp, Strain CCMP3275" /LENGTH=314 /DNA_ID=CAMNT_0024612651 /DNA_START=111 /DNA_END=1055 /DNA_ORIENTATION=-